MVFGSWWQLPSRDLIFCQAFFPLEAWDPQWTSAAASLFHFHWKLLEQPRFRVAADWLHSSLAALVSSASMKSATKSFCCDGVLLLTATWPLTLNTSRQ